MRRLKYLAASIVVTLGLAPLLMGPTSAFPSRPQFQAVTVGADAPSITLAERDQVPVRRNWTLNVDAQKLKIGPNDAGLGGVSPALAISRGAGAVVTSVDLGNATDNPAVTVNGLNIAPSTLTPGPSATVTGCSTAPSPTFLFEKIGNLAIMQGTTTQCVSNATTFTVTGGVPAGFVPSRLQYCYMAGSDNNTSSNIMLWMQVAPTTGTLTFFPVGGSTTAFTASGTKGFLSFNCSYFLN